MRYFLIIPRDVEMGCLDVIILESYYIAHNINNKNNIKKEVTSVDFRPQRSIKFVNFRKTIKSRWIGLL